MNNSNKGLRGEKCIRNTRVTIVESNGRYFLTVFKRGWFKEKVVVRIVIDDFNVAMKTFGSIF